MPHGVKLVTFISPRESVKGQTRTSVDVCDTTGSPPEADMTGSPRDVAEVPNAVFAPAIERSPGPVRMASDQPVSPLASGSCFEQLRDQIPRG